VASPAGAAGAAAGAAAATPQPAALSDARVTTPGSRPRSYSSPYATEESGGFGSRGPAGGAAAAAAAATAPLRPAPSAADAAGPASAGRPPPFPLPSGSGHRPGVSPHESHGTVTPTDQWVAFADRRTVDPRRTRVASGGHGPATPGGAGAGAGPGAASPASPSGGWPSTAPRLGVEVETSDNLVTALVAGGGGAGGGAWEAAGGAGPGPRRVPPALGDAVTATGSPYISPAHARDAFSVGGPATFTNIGARPFTAGPGRGRPGEPSPAGGSRASPAPAPPAGSGSIVDAMRAMSLGGARAAAVGGATPPAIPVGGWPPGVSPGGPTMPPRPGSSAGRHALDDETAWAAHWRSEREFGRTRDPYGTPPGAAGAGPRPASARADGGAYVSPTRIRDRPF
jgi:hypothetical protein